MRKQIMNLIFALVMVLILPMLTTEAQAATAVASGYCGANVTWQLDDAGTLTISGIGAMEDYSHPGYVPWYSQQNSIRSIVLEEGVTSIGDFAFYSTKNLSNITLPTGVTSVGYCAFYYCTSLSSITIPDSVTSIGDYAFLGCTNLSSITIMGSVTRIGDFAFQNCTNLSSITIPESVTSIGNSAFENCDSLTGITIPEGVTSIGEGVFYDCDNLSSITIPDSVTSIGPYAFYGCASLGTVHYAGTEEQQADLTVLANNLFLTGAIWHYECDGVNCNSTGPDDDSRDIPVSVLTASAGDYETSGGSTEGPAYLVLDNDFGTLWHTDWYGTSRENHWIQFELAEDYLVDGLRYKPRQGSVNGIIVNYEIQISDDGVNFTTIAEGYWNANANWKIVTFEPVNAKYVRLASIDSTSDNGRIFASAAEIRLTGEVVEDIQPTDPVEPEVTDPEKTDPEVTEPEVTEPEETKPEVTEPKPTEPEVTEPEVTEPKPTEPEVTEPEETQSGITQPEEDTSSENPFVDVFREDYYYDPVLWAVKENITKGMDETHFAPTDTCTRGQIVTFLWRACGSPEPKSGYNPFQDVNLNDYFYKAVLWAVENGITSGVSANQFASGAPCTRGQVATFLWRSQGQPSVNGENIFTDIAYGAYYYDAVLWAVEKGITNGVGEGLFAPDATCTRGQIVTFLYRAMDK